MDLNLALWIKNLARNWKQRKNQRLENLFPSSFKIKHVLFRSETRIKSLKEIRLQVEQVSKQSFIEGWAKAEPSIVNQIVI